MKDLKKIAHYLKYTNSLQNVSFRRFDKFYHDNEGKPVDLIYLCPLCVKNKTGLHNNWFREDDIFTLDHYPPSSVGGKNTIMVCKDCNDNAGKDFDYALKDWIKVQCFNKKIPDSKIPIELKIKDVKGKYKADLSLDKSGVINFDEFARYPLVREAFKKMSQGQAIEQSITFHPTEMICIYKALFKAAYLYCFEVWGYDFVFSLAGQGMRGFIFKDEKHPLANWGTFFHMDGVYPPEGLCYVFKPVEQQAFLINFRLRSLDIKFECGVSILVPGAIKEGWESLKTYQEIVDKNDKFTAAMIKLPEDLLTKENNFPYTDVWNERSTFRIFGES